jgi:NADH:ubiquinone reductase (H+-translocating)
MEAAHFRSLLRHQRVRGHLRLPWACQSRRIGRPSILSLRSFHATSKRLPLFKQSTVVPSQRLHPIRLLAVSRSISTKPLHHKHPPWVNFLYRTFAITGFVGLGVGSLVLAFFIYDASTYSSESSVSDIPVSEAALSPRRGGPKNLPIADVLVDDEDCPEMTAQKDKPKLVVLGTGWGSVAMLKTLVPGDYHITVVSPVNYFLFTPMLPSATVGTLELRSLVEPVRRIVQRVRGHFLKAEAEEVEFSEKLVEVSQIGPDGTKQHFYLPYDKLVIGVGMLSFRVRNHILN